MQPAPPTEGPERALEGIGPFLRKLALGTILAILAVAGVLALWRPADAPRPGDPEAGRAAGAAASRRLAPAAETTPSPAPSTRTSAWPTAAAPESAAGREVERRAAAGELAEAQRRFAPCAGGDVRRVAWIDAEQRVRKLVRVRATGLVLEQWFDDRGALAEGVVRTTAGGRPWTRRTLVADGAPSVVDAPAGAVPDEPPPPLDRDPGAAFFAGPGCER